MEATLIDVVDEIGQLRMLLTSSYDHSDTLHKQLIRCEAALSIVEQERIATVAELERTVVAAMICALAPPAPAIVPSNPAPTRHPGGPHIRLTARKSVRRPSLPPVIDI